MSIDNAETSFKLGHLFDDYSRKVRGKQIQSWHNEV